MKPHKCFFLDEHLYGSEKFLKLFELSFHIKSPRLIIRHLNFIKIRQSPFKFHSIDIKWKMTETLEPQYKHPWNWLNTHCSKKSDIYTIIHKWMRMRTLLYHSRYRSINAYIFNPFFTLLFLVLITFIWVLPLKICHWKMSI